MDIKLVKLIGWVAMNKSEYDLENMSFFKSKKDAKRFCKGQEVKKVVVEFYDEVKRGAKL